MSARQRQDWLYYYFCGAMAGLLLLLYLCLIQYRDPAQCLSYCGFAEPWQLLYIIPHTTSVFRAVTLAKVLLAGFMFGQYVQHYAKDDVTIAVSSLIYAFTCFIMFWWTAPHFLCIGYLLPMIPICMEMCFRKRRFMPLALMTAFTYAHNLYLAMVVSFILLMYLLYRVCRNGTINKRRAALYGRIIMAHLFGVLAMITLLIPTLSAVKSGTYMKAPLKFDLTNNNWRASAVISAGLSTMLIGAAISEMNTKRREIKRRQQHDNYKKMGNARQSHIQH